MGLKGKLPTKVDVTPRRKLRNCFLISFKTKAFRNPNPPKMDLHSYLRPYWLFWKDNIALGIDSGWIGLEPINPHQWTKIINPSSKGQKSAILYALMSRPRSWDFYLHFIGWYI